jgi:BNR-Asp box repeat/BNR/Asp-box repeat
MTTLLAATGDGVARLTEREDGVYEVELTLGNGVQCVAVDPNGPETALAGARGEGVQLSEDGGRTWRDAELPATDVFSVAIGAADGAFYAGCEPSMLFRSDDRGQSWRELASLREIPSAPTWSFPPRPWTSHVRWIAPSPHDAGVLLAGIELGGLMRSEDGGETWSDHRPGAQRDVHALAWHPHEPGRAYEAGGGGAAWSDDGGETWRPADSGRDRHYTWALAVDPAEPERWFVSASTGPFAAHGRRNAEAYVYRWDGEGPWRPLDGGLPAPSGSMPYALLFVGDRLVAGLADGTLYASDDRGDTWRQLELRGQPLSGVVALAA